MRGRTNHRVAGAFTLVEVLVSLAVLTLLVALMSQLFNSAGSAALFSTNHMDSDARVRLLFARMSSDFSRMVKRPDVDYSLKTAAASTPNDQMAFYSEVSGYSSVTTPVPDNSISLVAYRLNTTGTTPLIERLGEALSWGGGTVGILPVAFLPVTIADNWPAATTVPTSAGGGASDPVNADYETIVPNAFRFEYYYQLHSGLLSNTPWDTTLGHTVINGLQDVAGIGLVLAVTDRKSSLLLSSSQLLSLEGQMAHFSEGETAGQLQGKWQTAVQGSGIPPTVQAGIRVYEQILSINTPAQ
jgi:hypothetical protein